METHDRFMGRFQPFLPLGIFAIACAIPLYAFFSLTWWENKGPYRSITAVADLDGDGRLDVIDGRTRWETETTSWAGVKLWMNQGGGKFVQSSQELPGGFAGAAADVDRDGDADLLILDGYRLIPALNQGGVQGGQLGVFKSQNSMLPKMDWSGHADMGGSVVLGDLNGDGAIDGYVTGCCYGGATGIPTDSDGLLPSTSWIWINQWDSRGWLEDRTQILPVMDNLPIRAAALADLDGDGDLDAFAAVGKPTVGSLTGLGIRVLFNDGAGNLIDSGQRLGDADSLSVALGDVDGDGDIDALVGTGYGAALWINQGREQHGIPGTFDAGKILGEERITALFLNDFDGDGTQDALLGGVDRAVLWLNVWGNGSFVQSKQAFRYTERYGLAVADFDGEGQIDIFAGTHDERQYSIWLNQGNGTFQNIDQ